MRKAITLLFALTLALPVFAGGRVEADLTGYVGPQAALLAATDEPVRNIILMIGDGMGSVQVAASRYHAVGPEGRLHMETLPVTGRMEVASADRLITDSAASATAIATGVRTENGRIATAPDGTELTTVLELAERAGMVSGLVASSRVTHATPASFAAHNESRGNEDEIAEDMARSGVDVLFGGGFDKFDELLEQMQSDGYTVATSREQLLALETLPAVGLVTDGPLEMEPNEPTLAQMTRKALALLEGSGQDFFVMIEGSQIDWGGHDKDEDRIVEQVLAFDMAVAEAIQVARRLPGTLLIVTADHETGGMSIVDGSVDGKQLEVEFIGGHHTAGPVPLYAGGAQAGHFSGQFGNDDLGQRLQQLLGLTEPAERP